MVGTWHRTVRAGGLPIPFHLAFNTSNVVSITLLPPPPSQCSPAPARHRAAQGRTERVAPTWNCPLRLLVHASARRPPVRGVFAPSVTRPARSPAREAAFVWRKDAASTPRVACQSDRPPPHLPPHLCCAVLFCGAAATSCSKSLTGCISKMASISAVKVINPLHHRDIRIHPPLQRFHLPRLPGVKSGFDFAVLSRQRGDRRGRSPRCDFSTCSRTTLSRRLPSPPRALDPLLHPNSSRLFYTQATVAAPASVKAPRAQRVVCSAEKKTNVVGVTAAGALAAGKCRCRNITASLESREGRMPRCDARGRGEGTRILPGGGRISSPGRRWVCGRRGRNVTSHNVNIPDCVESTSAPNRRYPPPSLQPLPSVWSPPPRPTWPA